MIIDRLDNWNIYFKKESALYEGIEFILKQFTENMQDGRYEINGSDVYAMVQSYHTENSKNKKMESHRRYIDIQYIVSGRELIEWVPVSGLYPAGQYSEEKDVVFYDDCEEASSLILAPGFFAVFYPHDAHRPGCVVDKPESVRKIVIKVKT